MKKNLLLMLLIFIVNIYIYSEGIYFKTIREAKLYSDRSEILYDEYVLGHSKSGEKVNSTDNFYWVKDINEKYVLVSEINYNNSKVLIKCSDLTLLEPSNNFDPKLISELNNDKWIMSYYQDVVKSKNRETLFKYEPYWKTWKDPEGVGRELWEDFRLAYGEFSFSNLVILIYHDDLINLIIKSIKNETNTYIINVKKINIIDENPMPLPLNWSRIKGKEYFNIILKIDGDYMDIYLEDENTKLCELINVNSDFMDAFNQVIDGHTASVDLDKIKWPQRAGKITIQTNKTSSNKFQVTANLRIRESADTTAKIIITIPQGSKVEILEKGKSDTINNIKGNWVKVKAESGETGWCFDGYLEEIK